MDELSVSMVTPVWNGVKTIAQTIESVRSQGRFCREYIVMDSMSNDGTSDIVRQAGDVVTHHIREKDAGLYDGMNRGVALAGQEIVGIINADDCLCPGALARVVQAFADPAVDYVFSDVDVMNDEGESIALFPARRDWLDGTTAWHGRDWRFIVAISHPGLFVRRRVYEQLGAFDLRYRLAADHEFIARLISRGMVGRYLPEPLARFRVGGVSAGDFRLFREDELIARQYGVPGWLARMNRYRSTLGRIKARALGRLI